MASVLRHVWCGTVPKVIRNKPDLRYIHVNKKSNSFVNNCLSAACVVRTSTIGLMSVFGSNRKAWVLILTWICLTAVGYVRSDASDLTLAHSHGHKWHHAAAAMPANNVLRNNYNTPTAMRANNMLCNSYNTRPLLCARITCCVTVITQAHCYARAYFFSVLAWQCNLRFLTALLHSQQKMAR
jgi:hypothetical protein